jgi:hypothetical protein
VFFCPPKDTRDLIENDIFGRCYLFEIQKTTQADYQLGGFMIKNGCLIYENGGQKSISHPTRLS